MSKFYCPAPWHGGYFTQQGCSVCCVYPVDNISPQELINSPKIKEIKQGLISDNLDPACAKCVEKEQHGFNSMRLIHIEQSKTFNTLHGNDLESKILPQNIEVRFTNVCNFKCRMCYPNLSHLIADEINDHPKIINWYSEDTPGLVESGLGTKFFDEIVSNSAHLKRLYLTGGEPTISKAVVDYIKIIVDAGYAKNITLAFSTNVSTINPLFNKWLPEFKKVEILLSLDAVGEIAEYQRHGTIWDRVEKNVQYYRDLARNNLKKYNIGVHIVITAYSVLGIDHLFEYLNTNQLHGNITVCYEDFYKVQALTGVLRKSAIESSVNAVDIAKKGGWSPEIISVLESLIFFLRNEPEIESDWQLFCDRTKSLDKVRNEDFSKVFGFDI